VATNATDAWDVSMLDRSRSDDPALVEELAGLINRVYAVAEQGLWKDGATRTAPAEVARLIAAEEMFAVEVDGRVAGGIRIHAVAEDRAEFGLLVADPELRGVGIGRALVEFAERRSRERGVPTMQLELLVPREWRHPSKELLRAWYGRRGYEVARVASFEESYPNLAPMLATACDLEIYELALS
jgi:GNAT superfamily N-acetyltransferase